MLTAHSLARPLPRSLSSPPLTKLARFMGNACPAALREKLTRERIISSPLVAELWLAADPLDRGWISPSDAIDMFRSLAAMLDEKLSKEDVTELLRKCQCPLTGRVPFEKFQSLLVYNAPRLRLGLSNSMTIRRTDIQRTFISHYILTNQLEYLGEYLTSHEPEQFAEPMLWALAIGGNTELLPTLYRHFQIGEANPYARIAPESIPFAAAHWDINDSKYRVFAHQQTAQQVKALLDAKADPNVKYGDTTPVHSLLNAPGALLELLAGGARPDMIPYPLAEPATVGTLLNGWAPTKLESLKHLLNFGADPNARNHKGHTLLRCHAALAITAYRFDHEVEEKVVQELLTARASPELMFAPDENTTFDLWIGQQTTGNAAHYKALFNRALEKVPHGFPDWTPQRYHFEIPQIKAAIKTIMILAMMKTPTDPAFPQTRLWLLPRELLFEIFTWWARSNSAWLRLR